MGASPTALYDRLSRDPAKLSKKGRRGVRAIGDLLIQNVVDAGIELIKLSGSERAAFASKAGEVHDKFRDTASAEGKALFDKIKAAL